MPCSPYVPDFKQSAVAAVTLFRGILLSDVSQSSSRTAQQMRSKCRWLKEAIDYQAINRYLHGGQHINENATKVTSLTLHFKLENRLSQRGANDSSIWLISLGKSIGDSTINPVFLEEDTPPNMREEADVLLSRIYLWGIHYNQLYLNTYHSQGKNNSFRLCESRGRCAAFPIGHKQQTYPKDR